MADRIRGQSAGHVVGLAASCLSAVLGCNSVPLHATVPCTDDNAQAGWPMVGRCASHRASSPLPGPMGAAHAVWEPTSDLPSAPVTDASGTLYLGSQHGRLTALDTKGHVRWMIEQAGDPTRGRAVGGDGTIYSVAIDGSLLAIAADGSNQWRFAPGRPMAAPPVIAPDGTVLVIASGSPNTLYALRPDGRSRWSFDTVSETAPSSPAAVADNGIVYATANASPATLYSITADGQMRWSAPLDGVSALSNPTIGADGSIYVRGNDGRLYAFASNGHVSWKLSLGSGTAPNQTVPAPAIGPDGMLYVGFSGGLQQVRPDGTPGWAFKQLGITQVMAPTVTADGSIYAVVESGPLDMPTLTLLAFTSSGSVSKGFQGSVATQGQISQPIVGADGSIYVAVWDQMVPGSFTGRLLTIGP